MSVIKDIKELVDDIKTAADTKDQDFNLSSRVRKSSIARQSQDAVLQFPVIASRSLDIDTLQIINKSLERNYVTFVQIAVSLDSVIDIAKHKNVTPRDIISQFHTNVSSNSELIVDVGDLYDATTESIVKLNKKLLMVVTESLNMNSVNSLYTPEISYRYNFKDKALSAKYNAVIEANKNQPVALNRPTPPKGGKGPKSTTGSGNSKPSSGGGGAYPPALNNPNNPADKGDSKPETTSANTTASNTSSTAEPVDSLALRAMSDPRYVLHANMLQDNDVKKSNELMATTLHVRVKLINSESGTSPGVVDFLIGVKAVLHPVTSQEMVMNVAECYRNNSKVFQFLRWTTGEISFIKDLILNLDDTKKSAIDEFGKGGSPWWNTLKRLRNSSKLKQLLTGRSLLPNATIVMSREEALVIQEKYGYDLTKRAAAKAIMDNYHLLGFVIVDTSMQAASFLFDGRPDFETVSFSGLEKENSASERKFKEMLKAVNRF